MELKLIAVALLLTAVSCRSHRLESAADQYQLGEDETHLTQRTAEATDHPVKTRVQSLDKKLVDISNDLSDNYHFQSRHDKPPPKYRPLQKRRDIKKRRSIRSTIIKRSYYPYRYNTVQQPANVYPTITQWRPPVYQMSRPYYIPVYGVNGRIPIYYPADVYYVNPGNPPDNPPFVGPTYLPPPEVEVETTEPTTIKTPNRFGEDEDDGPVWDMVDDSVTRRPTSAPRSTPRVIPTRATKPPNAVTHPPLIHGGSGTSNTTSIINEASESQFPTPSKVRPDSQPLQPFRPQITRPTTTPTPDKFEAPAGSKFDKEPSRCVWAIISCCSTNQKIHYSCFEAMGCNGAFWDTSPCESQFAEAAIQSAINYYENSNNQFP